MSISLVKQGDAGVRVALGDARVAIGRNADNEFVLDDEQVSGYHANIYSLDGEYVIVDAGSTNGTFVNGERLQGRRVLKPNDRIGIGNVVLTLEDPASRKATVVRPAIQDEQVAAARRQAEAAPTVVRSPQPVSASTIARSAVSDEAVRSVSERQATSEPRATEARPAVETALPNMDLIEPIVESPCFDRALSIDRPVADAGSTREIDRVLDNDAPPAGGATRSFGVAPPPKMAPPPGAQGMEEELDSDADVVAPQFELERPIRLDFRDLQMKYDVTFGSAFAVDRFGFVRKGQVAVEGGKVVFLGKKRWSILARLGVFLGITVLPLLLFDFGLGWLLALILIHYFCASDGNLFIQKASITDVLRQGRQIRFRGQHPESGKTRKTVFKVDTEENAISLEHALRGESK